MFDKYFIELYAKSIEDRINQSIKTSMEGVCNTIRNFAYDIIAREAPELDERYRQKLLDEWIPSMHDASKCDTSNTLFKNTSLIPPSMIFEMANQFVRYGIGKMDEEEVEAVKAELGTSWAEKYWNVFPSRIRCLVKEFIKNEISFETFNEKLTLLLELS